MQTWNDYKEHIHQIGDTKISQNIKGIEEIASIVSTLHIEHAETIFGGAILQ